MSINPNAPDTGSKAAALSDEERRSLRESLLSHMDKSPMRERVMSSVAANGTVPRSVHIAIAAVIILAVSLVLVGFLLVR